MLDEPTNDLDLETLDLLEEVIADYPGTALLVSHDRDFLDRVATSIVLAEGDGRFTEYAGGYADMLAQRGADGAEARLRRAKPAPSRQAPAARPRRRAQDEFRRSACPENPAGARSRRRNSQMAELEQSLSDAALYARDPGAIRRICRPNWRELRAAERRRRGTLAGPGNGARGAGTANDIRNAGLAAR